ncbi:DsrE family protein [Moorella naiadis]|uniref:DsrE family protein n=1 Tax=Moorella naiadis (nom. illeg.) TaxID=3093670 RepID=UPI003D9C9D0A
MEKVLILIPSAPYGTAAMVEGYRYAIGMASLEVDTTVVLLDDGVWAVHPGQKPEALQMKSLGEAFGSIEEMGVKLLVLEESLAERGIPAVEILAGQVVDLTGLGQALAAAEGIIQF